MSTRFFSVSIVSSLVLALAVGCTPEGADALSYRPSMTQLRIGEVVVEEPPVIPDDNFIPGITINSEDVIYPGDAGRRAPRGLANLTDFRSMIELENPTMLEKHVNTYDYTVAPGSLIDEKPSESKIEFDDVVQGAIGDCYLVSSITAVVFSDNDNAVTGGMVRDVTDADGNFLNYVVRFYDAYGAPQDIEVDPQLVRRYGRPLYARSADSKRDAEELWVGIVEKAYAKWHTNYDKIGNGGYGGDVMQALTGANAAYKRLKYQSDASLYRAVRDAIDGNRPVVSGTFGEDSGVDYSGTGVHAWHSYTVLDIERTVNDHEDTEYKIKLRNPWGESEPAGNGEDDGIFWLPFRDWRKLYNDVTIGGTYEVDRTAPAKVVDLTKTVAGDSVVLNFTATGDDATDGLANAYDIRISSNPLNDDNFFSADKIPSADPQAPGTKETVSYGPLDPGTYYVALRVSDESGNIAPMSNVVSLSVGGEDAPDPQDTYFYEFNHGDEGWTTTGAFHYTGSMFYMGDDATGSYDLGDRPTGRLESPPINLTITQSPMMLWDQLLDVEAGSSDKAYLEITDDDGSTWNKVWEKSIVGDAWQSEFADLSQYAGKTIRMAFVFDATDASNNSTEGWRIDTIYLGD